MALFDLLGRNWAMGIIWHLRGGPSTFRNIQEYCENISPTTLNVRIKELTHAQLIQHAVDGYQLTPSGEELFELIHPMGQWAKKWAENFKDPQ